MLVDSIMSHPVVTVPATATIREAAQRMTERALGSLVVERAGRAAGILTERDLVTRVLATGLDPEATPVAEVMSSPLVTIEPSAHVDEAIEAMAEHGIKRLVVALEGQVRGLVTVTDLAHAQPELARRLRSALGSRWED